MSEAAPRSAGPPSTAARLVGVIACLILGGLALGSGFDRLSAKRLDFAARTPRLFASEALRAGGRKLIEQGNALGAVEVGKLAIDDAPVDPSSAAILGAGLYASGDRARAQQAFRLAGELGWRIPYTQVYWLSQALSVRDYRVAALRLDALFRQDPKLMRQGALLDAMELKAEARPELARRMKNAPWAKEYARDVADLAPDIVARRAMVLGELSRQGGALGCDAIAPIVSRLIEIAAPGDAGTVWRGHCPGAAANLIYDGNFAQADMIQTHSEFAWTFLGESDVGLVLEPSSSGAGRELAINASAAVPRQFLRQLILAPAGPYRLSWRSLGADGPGTIEAAFSCNKADFVPLAAVQDPQSKNWSAEVTLDGACTAHWLVFRVKPGSARLNLGDIALKPL